VEAVSVFGLVLIGGALLLVYFAKRSTTRAQLMATTETKRLADVLNLIKEIRTDLPGESESGYVEFCELKGKLVTDAPVQGELSGHEVAIYETRVTRVFETRRERRDANGNVNVTWHKSSETLSSNRREAEVFLDDGSARVRLIPSGAELALDKVVDRFEPPNAVEHNHHGGFALRAGSFSLSLTGTRHGDSRRTLGYRFQESVLPLDSEVYVLAEIADTSDGALIRKPTESEAPFVVSLKTEAELIRGKMASAKWLKIAAALSGIAGVALVVMGLLK